MSTVSWIKYPSGGVGKEEKTEHFKLSSNLTLTTLGITYLQRSKQANSQKLTMPFQSPPAFQGFAICWNKKRDVLAVAASPRTLTSPNSLASPRVLWVPTIG